VDAFNRFDIEAAVAYLDPDFELREWPNAPGAQTYHGADGARRALDKWLESWEWMHVEVEDIIEAGDSAVVKLHQRAKGSGSGIEVEIRSWNVYTFRAGKVLRLELFTEREPALEAAGLDRERKHEEAK
jgi:ketosteroid isomerase-like protein